MSGIPPLDNDGFLPPGIHHATLNQVVNRYGCSSLKRIRITGHLKQLFAAVADFADEIYIDGSYVTAKANPNDLDLIIRVRPNFNFHSRRAADMNTAIKQADPVLRHAFVLDPTRPHDKSRFQHYLASFQKEFAGGLPTGRRKGIVSVEV